MSTDLLLTTLGIVLVAAAAVFALLPFARGTRADALTLAPGVPNRFGLYRRVVELEFDHQLGKLSAEDLEQQSGELMAEAGRALREERGSLSQLNEEIEREIAAARAASAAARQ